ncbi:hypothetical protein [Paracoccus sediminilitoris]|uniref:hypothetical protein n=1 Tax=Paracoccus sediminilitoris TaxID=2202419 RepID=UPI0011B934B3|nr:hypothetical protein [Paracoccus sediminilitoris]
MVDPTTTPPFTLQGESCAMRIQILAQVYANAWRPPAHIDHDRLRTGTRSGHAHHDPGEAIVIASRFPAVGECLGLEHFPSMHGANAPMRLLSH